MSFLEVAWLFKVFSMLLFLPSFYACVSKSKQTSRPQAAFTIEFDGNSEIERELDKYLDYFINLFQPNMSFLVVAWLFPVFRMLLFLPSFHAWVSKSKQTLRAQAVYTIGFDGNSEIDMEFN